MKRLARLISGFAAALLVLGVAQAEQRAGGENVALAHNRADAYCKSHPTGPALEMVMMSGGIGQGFIAGDVDAVDGRRLKVKLLKGDELQTVELAKRAIVCIERNEKDLKSVPLSEVKVGAHVFGAGRLMGGVFVVRKVFYVMIFEDEGTQ